VPARAGYNEGLAAYKKGETALALKEFLPLAQMKVDGVGMPADPEGAVPILEKLAAEGDVNAQSLLGSLALQGKGMTKDYERAALHLADATRQGDISAAFILAQLYLKEYGVDADAEKGLHLIVRSASAGIYQAMVTLAATLANASDGVDRDLPQAFKWITIVLNRAPQGDLFYAASGIETQIRPRLSNRQIEAAQAEASRFVPMPMKAEGK
jgi:TPR repeat protein